MSETGLVDNAAYTRPAGRHRVFYGWWIVFSNAAITFYAAGTYFYGFGAFINPLKHAFGWSTTEISLAFSIRSAESGPVAPVVGYFLDRFGPRAVTAFGVCATGLGFLLLSRMDSLFAFYASYMVIALGTSACMGVTPMTNISNWFVKKRGRALGVYTVGVGLSGLMVPLVAWLLGVYHWRTVFLLMAIGMWLVGLPLTLLLRHRPEKQGLLPDGAGTCDDDGSFTPTHLPTIEGLSTREAVKHRSFWLLSFVFLLAGAPLTAVTVFLIPYLTDPRSEHGLALAGGMAAAAVTIMTLSSLPGRFACGWLGDYYNKRYVLIVVFVLQAGGLLVLAMTHSAWHLLPFFLLFAPSYGGIIALRPAIMADYFGRRCLGTIQGLSLGVMTIGGVLTPFIMGSLRDSTGGYRLPFLVLASAALLAVPLLMAARHPRPVGA